MIDGPPPLMSGLLTLLVVWLGWRGPDLARSAPSHGVVATSHPLATQAGLDALREGGNAVDAAVAAGLMLGVADGHNSGIGGGCFMLLRRADGSVFALDGRETAPMAIRAKMYLKDGQADVELSQTGAMAPGVPGSLAVYHQALARFGKLGMAQPLRRAADVARNGFMIDATYAGRLADSADGLAQFPESRRIFLRGNAEPYAIGDLLKQPDLAQTYLTLADQGVTWFYEGDFAKRAAAWMRDNGGVLRESDFARYRVKERTPIRASYRGFDILGFPPPSSGGVHVAQILNILESFDVKSLGEDSADFVHVVTEAMKLAFADRAVWLGDPDFVAVPLGLVDKAYGASLAKKIRMDRAGDVDRHGVPEDADTRLFERHTTHFSTADAEGNWVACTTTLNLSFGSKVVVPGTGVLLNNQMDDFALQPGVPNAFGLVGADANAVAPGKRPLSSMSPTIVLRGDEPILSVGAAGGPTIISQTVLAIIRMIDFGHGPAEALAGARFHHQWKPDTLRIEKALANKIGMDLSRRGHRLSVVGTMGACQAVGRWPLEGGWQGATDPRGEGQAGSL